MFMFCGSMSDLQRARPALLRVQPARFPFLSGRAAGDLPPLHDNLRPQFESTHAVACAQCRLVPAASSSPATRGYPAFGAISVPDMRGWSLGSTAKLLDIDDPDEVRWVSYLDGDSSELHRFQSEEEE
eukprot:5923579-Amphidinium_carterae.1